MSKYSEAGKGSKARKFRDNETYADNYDKIFGKKKDKQVHRDKRAELEELMTVTDNVKYDDRGRR